MFGVVAPPPKDMACGFWCLSLTMPASELLLEAAGRLG